jgi:hypothetical protein
LIAVAVPSTVAPGWPSSKAAAPSGTSVAYKAALRLAGKIGARPSASGAERRGHRFVARRFRAAGLRVSINGFRVPGRGRSRNVVGIHDTPRSCLKIVMGHADSVIDSTRAAISGWWQPARRNGR